MYFGDGLRVLWRQWLVVLIGMIAVGAAAGVAIKVVPTEYQSSGQFLLVLPGVNSDDGRPANPFLNLPPALTVTASLIADTLTNKDAQRLMIAAGYPSDYAIALDPSTGPLLDVTVSDTDPERAQRTRDELLQRLDKELKSIQVKENVPANLQIHSATSSVSEQAQALPGSKIRALSVIVAVGMVVTLFAAFLRDRLQRRPPAGIAVPTIRPPSDAVTPGHALNGSSHRLEQARPAPRGLDSPPRFTSTPEQSVSAAVGPSPQSRLRMRSRAQQPIAGPHQSSSAHVDDADMGMGNRL